MIHHIIIQNHPDVPDPNASPSDGCVFFTCSNYVLCNA